MFTMGVMRRGRVGDIFTGLLWAPFAFSGAGDGVGSVKPRAVRYCRDEWK